ncbi:GAF domain-containing sensor histidine kinase [Lysobacter sp. TY2-98]|uniref:GAF domain-containing sensor histidine kinase n=1 Tax=Lysobacter sp. TY2-98 TaxID=2290922 RepID=UPI0013B45CE2|nr:GAF domain-containing sensor histidine kinase [Lysobacter sp. TY2-98]
MAGCTDAQSIVSILARSTRDLIGADGVTVVMRDGGRCRYLEEDAIGALWKGQDFALDSCISGWCITTGEPVIIPDIRQDPRIPLPLYEATFVRAMAMTPIVRDKPEGALGVYWATEHEATTLEMAALRALADSAALALANVQLLQELKRSSERKDAFLSSLANELGETLGPMRTSLHLRRQARDPALDARMTEVISEQLDRQARLIENLVDGSQLLTGQAKLHPRLLDLRGMVADVVRRRASEAELAEITLGMSVPDTAVDIWGEARRVSQALTHVLDNSIRCTPPDGRIDVHLEVRDQNAWLTVRDTGIGIARDSLPHLFEPFFKPSYEPARSVAGLGLGLSLVSSILQLHGGDVRIDSPGTSQGTEVVMRFPLGCLTQTPAMPGVQA